MSFAPAVTVLVPGWNIAPYAAEALRSLQDQTFPSWTAVLVDDGSTDGTAEVYARFAAEDARFRVVTHARRRGLSAARNTALDLVETPYVAFLDADDVMTPRALEVLHSSLTASGSDFVAGAYVRLRPEAGGYAAGEVQPWVRAATSPARRGVTVDEHPEATANVVMWSKLSRSSVWNGLRFVEGALYEDQQIAQRMYATAGAFDVVPDVVVQWRVRADGSSITQHESDPVVFSACLDAMRAGLVELTGHPAARAARARQIRDMDLPRLAAAAAGSPDLLRLLQAFGADLLPSV